MTTATATKPETARQRALTNLKFARDLLNKAVTDFPEDKRTFQTSPHDNHLTWTLGHLATTYTWFTGLVGGTPPKLPESFDKAFGHGAKPQPDAMAYPPLAEVKKQFDASFNGFIRTVEALPESEMTGACVGETHGFVRDRLDVVEKAVWHEGWHTGQVSTLRRALGLKPMFG